MWPPRQHRFARTTATGDDHAAVVGIHSHQKESQLGGAMACDSSQGQDSSPEERTRVARKMAERKTWAQRS